ncbi:hypothetical protein GCM10008179_08170 [Hansschlegelia plantiphila]|uniref:Uncharacterized protein n=1 Tax=Hansschlegelia plantiphila TaxID=374655 RepID=A0A9W6MUA2_9HYPH|nr:hypothetical protein GCM10008179_08170 [Hansschlegelia plantiphila]
MVAVFVVVSWVPTPMVSVSAEAGAAKARPAAATRAAKDAAVRDGKVTDMARLAGLHPGV